MRVPSSLFLSFPPQQKPIPDLLSDRGCLIMAICIAFVTATRRGNILSDEKPPKAESNTIINMIVWLAFGLTLFFVMITTFQRLLLIQQDVDRDALSIPVQRVPGSDNQAESSAEIVDAAEVLERAEDTVDSVSLLLSFLEGASVLLAVGLGAASIYGIRQSNQLRAELEEEARDIRADVREELSRIREDMRERRVEEEDSRREIGEFRSIFNEINRLMPKLTQISQMEDMSGELDKARHSLENTIRNIAKLLQADQEFRVRNFDEAYTFIQQVLDQEPDNPLALYLAGWVETHNIKGAAELGLQHLAQLIEQERGWPTAIAAYGVALRRKAMRMNNGQRFDKGLMEQAHGHLRVALGMSPLLVDFNQESFWGPLGGLLRDMDKIDDAIEAYQQALRVTPGSSYPQGNLASLLLRKAQGDESFENDALQAHRDTIKLAHGELAVKPNDYFLLMDLAMSHSILGRVDARNLEEARHNLDAALQMGPSEEHLKVSLRGWENLARFLPRRPQWRAVGNFIEEAIQTMDRVIEG